MKLQLHVDIKGLYLRSRSGTDLELGITYLQIILHKFD